MKVLIKKSISLLQCVGALDENVFQVLILSTLQDKLYQSELIHFKNTFINSDFKEYLPAQSLMPGAPMKA